MPPIRPPRLRPGARIAAITPSYGGPASFPKVYESGVRVLEHRFGLQVTELPGTRADPIELYQHPERRADDVRSAFEDEEIAGIFCTIGGDDSCRILPFLDPALGARHPKVLIGYSDSTTLLTHFRRGGLVTFHGPSIMAGFSQAETFPAEFEQHVRDLLFDPPSELEYRPYPSWTEGYPRWELEDSVGRTNPPHPQDGAHWLEGDRPVSGELFGGSLEVLEFLKGTTFWPDPDFWAGKVLFLETSEDPPTVNQVKWMLRNYGLQGALGRIRALLFGRARGYSTPQKGDLDDAVLRVVRDEFGRADLPIVTNLDFGHTDPQWILPLGGEVAIDPAERRIALVRPAVE